MQQQLDEASTKQSLSEETALGRRKKATLGNARRWRGIYFNDPEDKDFNETLNSAGKKLEAHSDSAMPCGLRKISWNSSSKAPLVLNTGKERSFAITTTRKKGNAVYECNCEAHELTRKRTPET